MQVNRGPPVPQLLPPGTRCIARLTCIAAAATHGSASGLLVQATSNPDPNLSPQQQAWANRTLKLPPHV
jgi:hypothetical protein